MKTTLTFTTKEMYGANMGEVNPLPDFGKSGDIHSQINFDSSIPEDESRYFNYGAVNGILPYLLQDGYDRNKTLKKYECVVLENDHLKAVFFPQFGGKLWSLFDKDNNRDLLHENPVFQPGNLGLRNAWCSGGVEWNIGMTGHTPYTLSQLHTATAKLSDGTPVLRMYEWERIRRVSYQIDAYLPEDSRYLFVRVRLCNTCDKETPIYWWSNIAVDETPDTRVIAPANEAFCFDYTRVITKRAVPVYDGIDTSYTTRMPRAMDLFYDIKKPDRKWEAALNSNGEGLIQTSTDALQGRKLFMWGNGPGGKHWQEFLAVEGKAYLEIQAGLANTQMEHLPMPANAKWEWLEAYGCMKADPKKVHSESWQEAYECVGKQLEKDLPRCVPDMELERLGNELNVIAEPEILGSGWAALELKRMGRDCCFEGEHLCFSEKSLNEEQAPWVNLLENGSFESRNVNEKPAAYLTQPEWITLLENAINTDEASNNWHSLLQLGVMYAANSDMAKAYSCFEKSLELSDNAWARRNIATLESLKENIDLAVVQLLKATELLPTIQLSIECGRALIKAKKFTEFEIFYNKLPKEIQLNGRLLAMLSQVYIELEKFDEALQLLSGDLSVNDMREGEVLLSDLWVDLHTRKIAKVENLPIDENLRKRALAESPIPPALDFRMKVD